MANMPADQACRIVTGADEMDEVSVEKWWTEICSGRKPEKPREKPIQIPFRPQRKPHGVTKTRTRDLSIERRVFNRLRHEAYCL